MHTVQQHFLRQLWPLHCVGIRRGATQQGRLEIWVGCDMLFFWQSCVGDNAGSIRFYGMPLGVDGSQRRKWAQLSGPNLPGTVKIVTSGGEIGQQVLSIFALADEKVVGAGLVVVKLGLAISIGDGTGGSV